MATWRELIALEMKERNESLGDLLSITLSPEDLDREFDDGFGGEEGREFTAWTANHVYFPACYDGSEWCASVPRNFPGEATEHVGGG